MVLDGEEWGVERGEAFLWMREDSVDKGECSAVQCNAVRCRWPMENERSEE